MENEKTDSKKRGLDKLLGFLSVPNPQLIGVDISDSHVKMVNIATTRAKPRLDGFAIVEIPQGLVNNGKIEDLEKMSDVVLECWRKLGTKNKNVAVSIPSSGSVVKTISVSNELSPEELDERIPDDAARHITFPMDEVALDWMKIGPHPTKAGEDEYYIVAARKEVVEDLQTVIKSAGLNPLMANLDWFATMTSIDVMLSQMNDLDSKNICVVEIGHDSSLMHIIHGKRSIWNRDLSIGRSALDEQVSGTYGVTIEEAARIVSNDGEEREDYKDSVLTPYIETMTMEIFRAVQFFYASGNSGKIDFIVICGLGAVRGLDESVANRTETDSVLANPFISMDKSNRISPEVDDLATGLLVATGLSFGRVYG